MGTSQYFNNQSATREQFLVEDLIIESIRNHGIDVYYIPRSSRSELDELFGDDPVKSFESAYPMEMYLETFNDFTGNQEFFSKFGLEVQKSANVSVARRTFEKYVPTPIRNTPKEGDLIWLPAQQKLMEIKFVEQEKNFFQLGRGSRVGLTGADSKAFPYMYGLSLELFKYNGELIETGIVEIDNLTDIFAFGVDYTLQAGGSGTYERNEIVYQGASLANATSVAYVSNWDIENRIIKLRNIKGAISSNTFLKGSSSLANWIVVSGNTMENASTTFEDNERIETEVSNILDFTEVNPFGEP